MLMFVVVILIQSVQFSQAFPASEMLCSSDFEMILNGKQRVPPGSSVININTTAVITVKNNKQTVAKIYPRDGLDSVLLDKKSFSIKTDKRTFIQMQSLNKITKTLKCEIKL